MKDYLWILILCLVAISLIANALKRSVWSPICPSNPTINALISHPGDCRKFFICLKGIAYPVSCPYGLTWSPTLNKCALVTCNNIQYTKPPKYNPLCPLDENPADPTHLPNDNDCEMFFECQGGFAFEMKCPSGLHWSVSLDSCEQPNVANCQRKDSTIIPENGALNPNCPLDDDPDRPTLLSYPGDCSKFYKCSYGKSYIISCPYGLHWDIKSNRCESPFKAQCNNEYTTLSTTKSAITSSTFSTSTREIPSQKTTELTTSAVSNPTVELPQCPSNGIHNFQMPGDCKRFFSCSEGKLYVIKCRDGREWSERTKGCIDAALAECSASNNSPIERSTTIRTTTKYVTTKRPTTCAQGAIFLSHPTDCHKFLQCDNGRAVERNCPSGLFWNHASKSCQWNSNDC